MNKKKKIKEDIKEVTFISIPEILGSIFKFFKNIFS